MRPDMGSMEYKNYFQDPGGTTQRAPSSSLGAQGCADRPQGRSLALPGFLLPPGSLLKAAQGYRDRPPSFPLLDTSEVRRKKTESTLEGFSFLSSHPK